jgi:hypothetical protein
VLKRIGESAYRLELPDHVRVHSVFHVSLLKPFVPDTFLRLNDSIPIDETGSFVVFPECLIDTRAKQLRWREIRDYLLKWASYLVEEATWMSLDELRRDFPDEVRSLVSKFCCLWFCVLWFCALYDSLNRGKSRMTSFL